MREGDVVREDSFSYQDSIKKIDTYINILKQSAIFGFYFGNSNYSEKYVENIVFDNTITLTTTANEGSITYVVHDNNLVEMRVVPEAGKEYSTTISYDIPDRF